MLEYGRGVVTQYSDHPLLFSLLLLAALFAGAGVVVEQFVGNGVAAAFLVIYAMLAVLLSGVGYAILFIARIIVRIRHRGSPS